MAKPLAGWKTWWDAALCEKVARAIHQHLDKLPGHGQLLTFGSTVSAQNLRDPHTAAIAEALLKAYPLEKQPSSYMLGDPHFAKTCF